MLALLRWLVRFVFDAALLVVLVAGLGLAAYVFYVPGWIEDQVRTALADRGLDDANFELVSLGYDTVELRDVRLSADPNAMSIGSVRVVFDPLALWSRRIDRVAIRDLRWRIACADGKVDLGPIAQLIGNANSMEGPSWSVGDLAIRDSMVTLDYDNRTWRLPLDTRAEADANAPYTVRYDADGGRLVVDLPGGLVTDDTLAGRWIGNELGAEVSGRAGASASVGLDGAVRAEVVMDDIDAGYTTDSAEPTTYRVEGLRGRVALAGVDPLATEPGQQLHWDRLELGEIVFARGVLRFTMESPDSVLVEKLHWTGEDGGRFWAMALRFDPSAPDVSVDLFVEQASLDAWLPRLTLDYATGRGRLTGRVPFRIRTQPALRLALGQGYLHATDAGRVSIEDPNTIDRMLTQGGLASEGPDAYPALVRRRLVQSLQRFEYDQLSFVMSEEGGQPVLTVHVAGQGADNGQEVNLTMNFTGYQDALDLALRMQLGLRRATDRLFGGR